MANREAARRCRDRRREREDVVRVRVIERQEQLKQADDDIFQLRETRLKLREALQRHEATECKLLPQVIVNTVELPPNLADDVEMPSETEVIKTEHIEMDPIVPMNEPAHVDGKCTLFILTVNPSIADSIIGQFNLMANFKFVCTTCHEIIEDGVACAIHAQSCSYQQISEQISAYK